jgi:hypothetical protein
MLPSDGPDAIVWSATIDPAAVLTRRQEEREKEQARLQPRLGAETAMLRAQETVLFSECRDQARSASMQHADRGILDVYYEHIWQGRIENGYWHFKNGWGERGVQPQWHQ